MDNLLHSWPGHAFTKYHRLVMTTYGWGGGRSYYQFNVTYERFYCMPTKSAEVVNLRDFQALQLALELFTVRGHRSALIYNSERGHLRVNRLCLVSGVLRWTIPISVGRKVEGMLFSPCTNEVNTTVGIA